MDGGENVMNSQLIAQAATTNARLWLINTVNVLFMFWKIFFIACNFDLLGDMAGHIAIHSGDKEHEERIRLPLLQLKTLKLYILDRNKQLLARVKKTGTNKQIHRYV